MIIRGHLAGMKSMINTVQEDMQRYVAALSSIGP